MKDMTKKERAYAAFHGLETDHVPVCMWKHVPEEFRADDDLFAKCQADAYRATDVDFMKLSADGFFCWPEPVLSELKCAQDLYGMKQLGADHPFIRRQIDRTKKVVRALEGDCCALYLIFAPLSCLRLQIGYPAMMKLIREDAKAVKYACDVITEDLKILADGILGESGCDGIFYSVQNGEENRFTEEEYRAWVRPSDLKVLEYINQKSDMNAIHFCAWEGDRNRLSVWKDYHAPVISWSRFIDQLEVAQAQDFFGTTVWGGFDNRPGTLLYTGTREEIEAETRRLIEEGGKKGYIIGADCSLHDELREEVIRWIVQTARSI